MNFLISDSYRLLKITLLCSILLLFCYYAYRPNLERTRNHFTGIAEGERRTFAHLRILARNDSTIIAAIPDGRFPLEIAYPTADVRVGEIVNVVVVKHETRLVALDLERRTLRSLKVWISAPVILFVVLLLYRDLKFDRSRRQFTLREKARHA